MHWLNDLLLFALYFSQGSITCFGRSYFLRKQTALERTRSYLTNYNSFFLTRNYKQFVLENCALSYPYQAESGLPSCKTRDLEATVPQEIILILIFAGLCQAAVFPR